jgi:hypothetical protein
VEDGFLPGLSGGGRQHKKCAQHGCASGEGGAVEFAGLVDQRRGFWVGSIGGAFETVERFVAWGLRGGGVLRQDCQCG